MRGSGRPVSAGAVLRRADDSGTQQWRQPENGSPHPPLVSKSWSSTISSPNSEGFAWHEPGNIKDASFDGDDTFGRCVRPKSAGLIGQRTLIRPASGESLKSEKGCSFSNLLAYSRQSPHRKTERVLHPRPKSPASLLRSNLGSMSPCSGVTRSRPSSACATIRLDGTTAWQQNTWPRSAVFNMSPVLRLMKQIESGRLQCATTSSNAAGRTPDKPGDRPTTPKHAKAAAHDRQAPPEMLACKVPPKVLEVYSSPSPTDPLWRPRHARSRSPLPRESPGLDGGAIFSEAAPQRSPQAQHQKAQKVHLKHAQLQSHLKRCQERLEQNRQLQRQRISPRFVAFADRPSECPQPPQPVPPKMLKRTNSLPVAARKAMLKHALTAPEGKLAEVAYPQQPEASPQGSPEDATAEKEATVIPPTRTPTSAKRVLKKSATTPNFKRDSDLSTFDADDAQPAAQVDQSPNESHRKHMRRTRKSTLYCGEGLKLETKVKAAKVFGQLASQGEVITDDLPEALAMLGNKRVDKQLVSHIVHQAFNDRSHLDRDEFFEFVFIYEDKYLCHIKGKFKDADVDGSGTINASELFPLLRTLGITPLQPKVNELILEAGGANADNELGFREYVQILDFLHDRAGFTRTEADRILTLFLHWAEVDPDDSEEPFLAATKVTMVLSRLRVELTPEEEIAEIGPGSLSQVQFLKLVRRLFEQELAKVKKVFNDLDRAQKGSIPADSVRQLLELLGLGLTWPQAVHEITAHCNLDRKAELRFEEVCAVVDRFRETEGFMVAELAEIDMTFDKFQEEFCQPDGVSGFELVRASRWYGYPATLQEMQALAVEYMIGEARPLELSDLRRVLAHFRNAELAELRRLLPEAISEQPILEIKDEFFEALQALGHELSLKQFNELINSGNRRVDLWDIARMTQNCRMQARDRLRAQLEFDDAEVEAFRTQFRKHDVKNEGILYKQSLRDMLMEIFPNVSKDATQHTMAKSLLATVDSDNNKKIDFTEFQELMRLMYDQAVEEQIPHMRKKVRKEQAAVRSTRFTPGEIADFRVVFQNYDTDNSGLIDFPEFEEMIGCVLPSNTKDTAKIEKLMQSVDVDNRKALDFAELLIVMRKVLDEDWSNIRSYTEGKTP